MMQDNKVVISGISGTYPKSNNVKEFSDILYNQINPVTPFKLFTSFKHPEAPVYSGKIPNLDKFDSLFFKMTHRLSRSTDVMSRKVLEHTYQAIFDAGVSLDKIYKKKVGVFVGSSTAELEKCLVYSTKSITGSTLLGSSKSMIANRVSYWLNTTGPSFNIDNASCSSMTALEQAWIAITNGDCEAAIVAGCHINFHAQTLILNGRSMKLTMNDGTQSFSRNADGCVMSDAINVCFLQKAKHALRVYAEIEFIKCEFNSMSENKTHSFEIMASTISKFLGNFYEKANVSPDSVEFVEALGIADPHFDKEELKAIDDTFCKTRKDPLVVGSVMSNIGNTDAASGLTAVTKVLLAFHKGKIAPNLHYQEPHIGIAALQEGRLRIATNPEPIQYSYAAVNNFGYNGVMGHVLLKNHFKPKDTTKYISNIPYLVLISGRTEISVKEIIEYLKSQIVDPEELALLHNFYQCNILGHLGRGYVIVDSACDKTICNGESICYFESQECPIWFVYSGMGSQWVGMGTQLMLIPVFAAAIKRCQAALEPKGVDIVQIITSLDKTIFDNILNSFVGIAAIQIGLTDVLCALGIKPDGIIGHSVGELGCGYADGCLTAEEMILSAYSRGLVSLQTPFIHGSMAAIGVGYQKIIKVLPPEIEVACHNSPESCTISGPYDSVKNFVQELNAKSIFAKEVPCSNIAYHSRYIAHAGKDLLKYMNEIIKTPKLRSPRWVSTSVSQSKWDEPIAKYSSAEYYTNNLLSPVLFEETMRLIPNNAVLIEIAPHGLLQAILKRSLPPSCHNIALTNRGSSSNLRLLEGIGKIYLNGKNPNIAALYPKVEFPVSTKTPMLSHLVKWAHKEIWPIPILKTDKKKFAAGCNFIISTCDEEYNYLESHIYRGKNVFLFSAALLLVWDTLAMILNVQKKQLKVQFRDVHFYSQPILVKNYPLHVNTSIHRGTGRFEVLNDESRIATGFIILDTFESKNSFYNNTAVNERTDIDSTTIYQLLYEKSLLYKKDFQSIHSMNRTLDAAKLVWNQNWAKFIDGLIQINILRQKFSNVESRLCFIKKITIDVNRHEDILARFGNLLPASISNLDNLTSCGGVHIENMKFCSMPLLSRNLEIDFKITSKIMDASTKKISAVNSDVQLLGNYNTLRWEQVPKIQGPGINVKVHYAGINQHDAKRAEGSIPAVDNKIDEGFGMDFAGLTANGTRVMGLVQSGAVRSQVRVQPELLWPVPDHWSLEEAATVPLAYSIAFYCLALKYKLYPEISILVHGGAGALGQAVISIALAHDCEVFTTVSSIAKKRFLKKLFPKIKLENIGNSKNFENIVLNATKGKGCEYVINCGEGSRKNISLKCCKAGGVVMDTSLIINCENCTLGLSFLKRERTFVALNLLSIFHNRHKRDMKRLQEIMIEGIIRGYVRPLTHVTFGAHEGPDAFSFFSSRRHCGRLLIRVEESNHIISMKTRRVVCNSNLWSVIVFEDEILGSLIAERLVERGAKNLHLYCSSHSDYLNYKIQLMQMKDIKIDIKDINSLDKLSQPFSNKLKVGEIEGIYFITNKQNSERRMSLIIEQFQLLLKDLDQPLAYFVVVNQNKEFDEFINELNLSAMTVVNIPKIISVDHQNENEDYTSLHDVVEAVERAISSKHGVVEVCVNNNLQCHSLVQGLSDITGIEIPNDVEDDATIFDLCIDSNKSVAISIYLKEVFNISIPVENIPSLKVKRLYELVQILKETSKRVPDGLESYFCYKNLDELEAYMEITILPTLTQNILTFDKEIDLDQNYLYLIPGIESHHSRFRGICERLKLGAIMLQPSFEQSFLTESEQAQKYAKFLIEKLKISNNFYLLGYEYGVPIVLKVAELLEDYGLQGTVFCIGHTPNDLREEIVKTLSTFKDETEIREAVIHDVIHQLAGIKITLPDCTKSDWKKRLETFIRSPMCQIPHSTQYLLEIIEGTYNRLMQARNINTKPKSLLSKLVLLKASTTIKSDSSISLFKCYSQMPVTVYDLETPLALITKDPRCATIINGHLSLDIQKEFEEKNICETYLNPNFFIDTD